jgi:PIN domain nuclease of toxin-antitoxin system
VIILDTHVRVWWVDGSSQLPPDYRAVIASEAAGGLGVCAISGWEVAKLVELNRLQLAIPVEVWITQALQAPVQLIPLTPDVAVGSSQLPGAFHKDPADQMIVATARVLDCPLVTMDRLIRGYPHVRLAP